MKHINENLEDTILQHVSLCNSTDVFYTAYEKGS